jgi:hypothetical protein
MEQVDKFGLPQVPKLTPTMRHYFWRLDPRERTISNHGVAAFGMHYWSPDLMHVPRFDKQGRRRTFSIRFDPNELNTIALFAEEDSNQYVALLEAKELRRSDGSLSSLSFAKRKVAIETAKAKGKSADRWPEELDFSGAAAMLEETIETRKAEKRRVKRHKGASVPSADVAQQSQKAVSDLGESDTYKGYDALMQGWGPSK